MNFFQKDDGYWGKRQADREEKEKEKEEIKEVSWLGPAKEIKKEDQLPKLETYNDDKKDEDEEEKKDGEA